MLTTLKLSKNYAPKDKTQTRPSNTIKPCANDKCGQQFTPRRSTARFCSRACQHEGSNNTARATKRKLHDVEFIGVDGEGVGRGKDHKYVLLGCGDRQIADTRGLHWQTILGFLWECFLDKPTASYVGFFLGYDFAQWFKTLPRERAWRIFTTAGAAVRKRDNGKPPLPVDVDDWQIDCLGLKRIRFRPKGEKRWMYINDAGPFFQSSFLAVIDPGKWDTPVCSQEEFELVKQGKAHRSTAELNEDMKLYNRLENDILARVMKRYNAGLVKAGVYLSRDQWYGPGQAAQTWLRSTQVPTGEEFREAIPDGLFDFAVESYYAGWFEIMAHGHVRGTVWEYDINSAYPYVMAKLPCLLHGTWSTGRGNPPDRQGTYTLIRASVHGDNEYIGAMLHRCEGGGKLARPRNTAGVYWLHEVDAARRAGLIHTVFVEEWWQYEPCNCDPPLAGLAELYNLRIEIGKDTAAGKAFKLIYNSAYGKFAQSIGSAPFGNPVYASLITAGCRTMILEAIATHPRGASACIMVATDGVYFLGAHPTLECSESLGAWEAGKKYNLTLFKPGVYWDDAARKAIRESRLARFKARGVNAKAFSQAIDEIDKQFSSWDSRCARRRWDDEYLSRFSDKPKTKEILRKQAIRHNRKPFGRRIPRTDDVLGWPTVKFKVEFTMTTIGQALQWERWDACGEVIEERYAKQSSNPQDKRDCSDWIDEHNSFDGVCYRSRPYDYAFGGEKSSTPYERRFGKEIESDDLIQEIMTPDGNASMLLHGVLGE